MTENVTYGLNERTEVVRPLSTLLNVFPHLNLLPVGEGVS